MVSVWIYGYIIDRISSHNIVFFANYFFFSRCSQFRRTWFGQPVNKPCNHGYGTSVFVAACIKLIKCDSISYNTSCFIPESGKSLGMSDPMNTYHHLPWTVSEIDLVQNILSFNIITCISYKNISFKTGTYKINCHSSWNNFI